MPTKIKGMNMRFFSELRQKFIKDMVICRGFIGRNDIIERFGVGSATATRDITYYKTNNEDIKYNVTNKRYERIEL